MNVISRIGKLRYLFLAVGFGIGISILADLTHAPFEDNQSDHEQVPHAYFSPGDNIRQLLIGYINAESTSIRVAAYSFTDGFIAAALLAALERGVRVEMIVDGSALYGHNRSVALKKVHAAMPLLVHHPANEGLMHNKFMIFATAGGNGKPLLVTGSFNYTYSAQQKNRENVLVIRHPSVISRYMNEFEKLKSEAYPLLANQRIELCA